ncbi:MAG: hypothetical protein HC912_08730 [Saprospiraceae bacterium]|nr:hypothetical protein [Saprospiraceae bacterium]
MKPFQINFLNALVLIALGLWAYLTADKASPTALIPVGFGAIFLIATPLFRKGNKIVIHIIVLLTLLLIVALFMPLKSRIDAADNLGIARVAAMIGVSAIAMIIYIKSFVDARRARS